jgi:dihydroorotase
VADAADLTTVDTMLVGGRVIDPASGLDGRADVAVGGGRVLAVGPTLWTGDSLAGVAAGFGVAPGGPGVIDVTGCLVTPGLIDLHVHVFPGLGNFCVDPDDAGVDRGVPVVVDGGTSGTATFGLARRVIDDPSTRTSVLAFMDPCQLYLATRDFICHKLEIANDERNLDLDIAAQMLEEHRDVLVGLKVRACSTSDPHRSPFVEGAKSIAGDRPIMVHLGRFPHTPSIGVPDLLSTLRGGDVITHAFRGASGVLDGQGGVIPEFRDAVDRGVRLDVGHSGTDFRFDAARRLFDLGYLPTTISTDLNEFNVDGPVYSLPETMSKIWALGVPLIDVVGMTTTRTAETIGRGHELGRLVAGRVAEVSVLRVEDGPAALSDGYTELVAERRLVPVGCLRAGVWHPARAVTGAIAA